MAREKRKGVKQWPAVLNGMTYQGSAAYWVIRFEEIGITVTVNSLNSRYGKEGRSKEGWQRVVDRTADLKYQPIKTGKKEVELKPDKTTHHYSFCFDAIESQPRREERFLTTEE